MVVVFSIDTVRGIAFLLEAMRYAPIYPAELLGLRSGCRKHSITIDNEVSHKT